MNKMKHIFSMAALALMGAVMTGCSNDDNLDTPMIIGEANVVTQTITVNLDSKAATRALTASGVKTFAENDQIAVVYTNTSDATAKAVSTELVSTDITNGGKTATFTVTLTDPKASTEVKYIYPAAMAKENGSVNYDALKTQNGTLTSIAANLDLAIGTSTLSATGALPTTSVSMTNPLAILALTLKEGSSDITSAITGLNVSDGTNVYAVTRATAPGPIYVAINPTTSATIGINATDGTTNYYKELPTKTYAASNGYPLSLTMAQGAHLAALTAAYTAQDGETLTGTLARNYKISIANGATVTLKDLSINASGTWKNGNYAAINCVGDATIILSGTNIVKGFSGTYPGIHIPSGKTLIIKGEGSLDARSNGDGSSGIGGGNGVNCGNIEIQSGTITASAGGQYGSGIGGGQNAGCGNITISGGSVTANGGYRAAGIGSGRRGVNGTKGQYDSAYCGNITISGGVISATGGDDAAGIGTGRGNNDNYKASCGTINITSGVTSVTATKGSGANNSIGAGSYGVCGTVTIADGANVTQK